MTIHDRLGTFVLILAAALSVPPRASGQYWTVDTTFAPAIESAPSYSYGQPFGRAYPGGKFLTHGTIINGRNVVGKMLRLNADGTIDDTFNPPAGAGASAVYPDGRILVSTPIAPNYTSVLLQRLLGDGSVDPTFASVIVSGSGVSVVPLGDGRVFLFSLSYSSSGFRVGGGAVNYMAMLKADGALDGSFQAPVVWNSSAPNIVSVKMTSDGQHILVAGSALNLGTGLDKIARLNLDGSVDSTFNAAGANLLTANLSSAYPRITGGVLLVNNGNMLGLTSSGAADASFVPALVGSNFDFGPQQSDGKIFYRSLVSASRQLRRMNSDGSDDSTFAVISTPYGSSYEINQPTLSNDGTFFVGPTTAQRDAARFYLTHVQANGSIDPNFNPRFGVFGSLAAYARQPDGKHLIIGSFEHINNVATASNKLVRLNDDGTLDSGFNATLPPSSYVYALFIQPSGKILVFGRFSDGQGGYNCLLRFGIDGSPDNSFPPVKDFNTMAMGSSGYLYGITSGSASRLLRHTPDGVVDPTFTSFATNASIILPLSDGAVMLETSVLYYGIPSSLVRLHHDGTVDPNFKSPIGGSDKLLGLAALPDGNLLICRQYQSPSAGLYYYTVNRLLPNGTSDYIYTTEPGQATMPNIAGSLFDLLRVASPDATASTGLDLIKNFNYYDVNCRTDGQLMVRSTYAFTSGGPLQRYLRTALTSPSVDAGPFIMASSQSRAVTRILNDFFVVSEQVNGVGPFTYQWMKDGSSLSGKTTSFLVLQNLQASDAGVYSLKISNFYGSVDSLPTTLTIDTTLALVSITAQPLSQAVLAGGVVSFNVTATGLPVPTYQWYKDSVPINGATSSLYTITSAGIVDAGNYTVVVTNSAGSATSLAAALTIIVAPTNAVISITVE